MKFAGTSLTFQIFANKNEKKALHNRFKIYNLKEFVLIIFHNANSYFSGIFFCLF